MRIRHFETLTLGARYASTRDQQPAFGSANDTRTELKAFHPYLDQDLCRVNRDSRTTPPALRKDDTSQPRNTHWNKYQAIPTSNAFRTAEAVDYDTISGSKRLGRGNNFAAKASNAAISSEAIRLSRNYSPGEKGATRSSDTSLRTTTASDDAIGTLRSYYSTGLTLFY